LTVLNIRSPNTVTADRVLQAMIGDDPRIQFIGGLWSATSNQAASPKNDYRRAVALFIQKPRSAAHLLCIRGGLYRKDTDEGLEFDLTRSLQGLDVKALGNWVAATAGELLIIWSGEMLRIWNRLLLACRLDRREEGVLCLNSLAARALSRKAKEICPESLAPELGLPAPDPDHPGKMARFLCTCLDPLLELIPESNRFPAGNLVAWTEGGKPAVDFTRLGFGRDQIRRLPEGPGVYIMRNRAADIIYVGKAANLRRRVCSYFTPRALGDSKVLRIHEQIHSIETMTTDSELDALLLETRMIRDFRPPVNFQMEVHERPARYGKGRNIILLVKATSDEKVEAYFLCDGIFVGQQSARLGKPASKSLRAKIQCNYFPKRGRSRRNREGWELEIAARWLARNRRSVNFVDVDDAGDCGSTLRLLDHYLCDPDKLSKKVFYR
jgi:hypothetical protein